MPENKKQQLLQRRTNSINWQPLLVLDLDVRLGA
jgi:hypothetical protein